MSDVVEQLSGATTMCPATMCPLIAPDGSPWTRQVNAPCERQEPDFDAKTGCAWWNDRCGCMGQNLAHQQAALAADEQAMPVAGPRQPKRFTPDRKKIVWGYECPRAKECQWQAQAEAEGGLCAPRTALRLGLDPRVCLY